MTISTRTAEILAPIAVLGSILLVIVLAILVSVA